MCGINGRDKPGRERMDLDFFKRASKEARDAGVEECGLFFIGESTMAPALLVECLKYAKSIGYYTFLTTNGSLLNPMLAGELMAAMKPPGFF
jgi:pyruvate-formate lyase-activating enzyme